MVKPSIGPQGIITRRSGNAEKIKTEKQKKEEKKIFSTDQKHPIKENMPEILSLCIYEKVPNVDSRVKTLLTLLGDSTLFTLSAFLPLHSLRIS